VAEDALSVLKRTYLESGCVCIRKMVVLQSRDKWNERVLDGHWEADQSTNQNFCFDVLIDAQLTDRLNSWFNAHRNWFEVMTQIPSLGGFHGTIKRLGWQSSYRFPWHWDGSKGRRVGLSLCLSAAQGGAFEMRRKWSSEVELRVDHLLPGDVHVFDVENKDYVHRIAPVHSPGQRVFFSGWFT